MKPQKIIVYIKFKIWQKTLGTGRQKNRVININLILYILYFCLFRLQAQSLPGISDIYYSQQAHDLPAYAPFVGSCLVEALFRNDYCARELMYKSLGLHLAKDGNVFHLQVSHNGYAHFGEVRVGAGYGRLFGKHFSISLTAIYLCQHAEHYQGRHSFTVNLSACCLIGSRWGLSVGLFNPILMRYGISGPEVIPLTFSLQAHHQWSDRLLVFLRVDAVYSSNDNRFCGSFG